MWWLERQARRQSRCCDGRGPDAPLPPPCDPAAQTGCMAPTPKCAVTFPDPGAGSVILCTPAGVAATGEDCTRTTGQPPGFDNCINGYCSALDVGAGGTGRKCRRYCSLAAGAM